MKIKLTPQFVYPLFVLLLIVGLVILVSLEDSEPTKPSNELNAENIPQDDIHKGLTQPNASAPSKDNVSEKFKQQIEMLRQAVEADPEDTVKMREFADLLFQSHQADMALTYYQRILAKDPKRIDILFSVAMYYYFKQDYNKTEEYTRKVLAIDKNNSQALYNLGAIAASRGDKEKARQIWNDVIKKFPGTPIAENANESLQQL